MLARRRRRRGSCRAPTPCRSSVARRPRAHRSPEGSRRRQGSVPSSPGPGSPARASPCSHSPTRSPSRAPDRRPRCRWRARISACSTRRAGSTSRSRPRSPRRTRKFPVPADDPEMSVYQGLVAANGRTTEGGVVVVVAGTLVVGGAIVERGPRGKASGHQERSEGQQCSDDPHATHFCCIDGSGRDLCRSGGCHPRSFRSQQEARHLERGRLPAARDRASRPRVRSARVRAPGSWSRRSASS